MVQVILKRALLDSGLTNTFCSEDLSQLLGEKVTKQTFSLTTLDKENSAEETYVLK